MTREVVVEMKGNFYSLVRLKLQTILTLTLQLLDQSTLQFILYSVARCLVATLKLC